mmetsp:Transcript_43046/g.101230  ORF Transcript_43046/g.101230 Transcript_43046/m.101230 type:complete len:216 (+) Transcript_43046:325-972(+)
MHKDEIQTVVTFSRSCLSMSPWRSLAHCGTSSSTFLPVSCMLQSALASCFGMKQHSCTPSSSKQSIEPRFGYSVLNSSATSNIELTAIAWREGTSSTPTDSWTPYSSQACATVLPTPLPMSMKTSSFPRPIQFATSRNCSGIISPYVAAFAPAISDTMASSSSPAQNAPKPVHALLIHPSITSLETAPDADPSCSSQAHNPTIRTKCKHKAVALM